MWEFCLPRRLFCVTSAPGITSRPYCRSARDASDRIVVEILVERLLPQPEVAPPQRRHAADAREQILLHQDVIGDRDDIEPAGLAVEIDDLAQGQPAIAPPRVDVKIAEQKRFVARHHIRTSTCDVSFGRRWSTSEVKLRT